MDSSTISTSTEQERRRQHRLNFRGRLLLRRAGETEALILATICTLDMLTTLFWVLFGHAREANPLLAWTFQGHPATFVVIKCASCLPALILAPRLAQSHRSFTVWLLRAIIVAYIVLYFTHAEF